MFNRLDVAELLARIENLEEDAVSKWGEIKVNHMLAHCNAVIEAAVILKSNKERGVVGYVIEIFKSLICFDDWWFIKKVHEDRSYVIDFLCDFDKEKAKFMHLIIGFAEDSSIRSQKDGQIFIGEISLSEWGVLQWRHFDYHLRQFGV